MKPVSKEGFLAILDHQQFIINYAKEQPDIRVALQNFLLPDVGSTGYPDYKKRVTQLLKAGQEDRGFRKGADDGLTSIVDELDPAVLILRFCRTL